MGVGVELDDGMEPGPQPETSTLSPGVSGGTSHDCDNPLSQAPTPPYCQRSSGTVGLELFQAAVRGACRTMEHRWANALTTLSPEMGTGAIVEGLALEREEAQPLFALFNSACPPRVPSQQPSWHPN